MPILGKQSRKIFARRTKLFWEEFSRNKIGLVGIAILAIYIGMAIFAPWLTPYDPIVTTRLADSFAMPQWVTIYPQYKDLPPTMDEPIYWHIAQAPDFVYIVPGRKLVINFPEKGRSPLNTDIYFRSENITYPYDPPRSFILDLRWTAENVKDIRFMVEVYIVNQKDNRTRIYYNVPTEQDSTLVVHVESSDYYLIKELGYNPGKDNLANITFSEKGSYSLLLRMNFITRSDKAQAKITVSETRFRIPGLVHGVLGTDNIGADIYSQLVYGARISLAIGLIAALLSTSIGLFIGIASGYLGGFVDEVTMRIVDILLCLPALPLLLALVFLFGKSVWYIVLLIAIFGWQGLSRIVRSRVLSVREVSFVECAVASGASKFYIMMKHLVPNVLPVAFAFLVLAVPGAILTEAALSFLGFGDPRAPTWGRMLHAAFGFGAFSRLAWWWIIPPGLAITTICLAFVFIGHAVDEVVNPKLRRRR